MGKLFHQTRHLLLLIFSALSVCLWVASNASYAFAEKIPASGNQPRLAVPNTTFNFGTVAQGQKVEHSFLLRNDGSAPLKIEHLHATCGCTAAVVASDTIAAGEQTSMRVTFDTTGFQGAKVKTVRFYTNDSRQPSVLLTMQGNVEPDVKVSLPRIDFGKISKGQQGVEKTVVVSAAAKSGIRIQEVTARSANIEILSEDVPGRGESEKKIRVILKSTLPVGIFRDRVVVKTTSRNNPVVNIPVFARIDGDLAAEPSTVTFGLLEGPLAEPVSRRVRIANSSKKPLRILDIESDNANVQVQSAGAQSEVRKSAGGTELIVTVQAGVVGAFRARLKIKTDHADPEQQELVIPVYGIVTRGQL